MGRADNRGLIVWNENAVLLLLEQFLRFFVGNLFHTNDMIAFITGGFQAELAFAEIGCKAVVGAAARINEKLHRLTVIIYTSDTCHDIRCFIGNTKTSKRIK